MFKFYFVFGAVFMGADGLNILGLFPHPGKSHYDVFHPVLEELANRGHQLTVISHFDPPNEIKRWKQINMGVFQNLHRETLNFQMFDSRNFIMDTFMHLVETSVIMDLATKMCEVLTNLPHVHEIINNGYKFDVILLEQFNSECAMGIAHFIDAPVIGLQSHPQMPWTYPYYGQPDYPSYMPCIFLSYGPHMNFLERVENTITEYFYKALFKYRVFTDEREIVQKNLNRTLPPLGEIAPRTSALLSNTHFTLHGVKPLVPGVVEVNGMHIKKKLMPLEPNLEKFMNNSKSGVIVFSMGSMLKTSTLPEYKRDAFVEAFSKIDYDVIWKWEGELIPNLPKNILLMKWLPQFELLNHPKTVAFISHGGLLGTTEAVYVGIPMLFIPVFADQGTNSAAAVEAGLGDRVLYRDITKERIQKALTNVLSSEMRQSAKNLSAQWHDRAPPLKVAADTVEYVARYKGRRLRSPALDLTTYQLYNLDVLAFILSVLMLLLGVFIVAIYFALKTYFPKSFIEFKDKKND